MISYCALCNTYDKCTNLFHIKQEVSEDYKANRDRILSERPDEDTLMEFTCHDCQMDFKSYSGECPRCSRQYDLSISEYRRMEDYYNWERKF